MNPILESALTWASKGFPVFPCSPATKRPLTPNGFKEATLDPGTIEAWWLAWPDAMIGWPVNGGLWVMDIDPRHGGDATLARLEAIHGKLPETYTVETPSGGRHLYFVGEAPCTAGRIGAGIDTRGSGKGYVILPPSVSTSGSYRPVNLTPWVESPPWLHVLLADVPRSETPLSEDVAEVAEGGRNRYLFRYASLLRRRGLGPEEILALLVQRNEKVCRPPLGEDELRIIAGSAAKYEPEPLAEDPPAEMSLEEMSRRIAGVIPADARPPVPTPDAVADVLPSWADASLGNDEEWASARLTPRCIVQDYLYADVAQLVAPGSAGKTTLLLYEAVILAIMRPLWGLQTLCPCRTLILTKEDVRERLVARLRAICEALELVPDELALVRRSIALVDLTGYPAVRLATVERGRVVGTDLARRIVDRYFVTDRPDMVVFDPLVSFGADETLVNANEQALIEAARTIIRLVPDTCVRLVHHTGKMAARDGLVDAYAGRGGSALADGSRMVTVLRRLGDGENLALPPNWDTDTQNIVALVRAKLSYSPPNLPDLLIRRTGFAYSWAEAESESESFEAQLSRLHTEVIRVYQAEPGERTLGGWAALLKDKVGSKGAAEDLLQEMTVRGWLAKEGSRYAPAVRTS